MVDLNMIATGISMGLFLVLQGAKVWGLTHDTRGGLLASLIPPKPSLQEREANQYGEY